MNSSTISPRLAARQLMFRRALMGISSKSSR